jgi:hypothetical protein
MARKLLLTQALAIAVSFGMTGPAAAQDRDMLEVQNYVLTNEGLAKFKQATTNLTSLPGACEKESEEDDGSDSKSIDQMVAEINAMPGARAALESAGMAPREYVVFSWSLLQNGMAAWASLQPGGKLPPGVKQSNVDFYRKHEAEFEALGKTSSCPDEADDEEPEPEPDE